MPVLNVRDPGGPFAPAFEAAYYRPFTAETGIRIQRREGGQEPSDMIRDMVERSDFVWDVALTSQSANLAAAPWLDDISGVPAASRIPESQRSEHFQGDNVYAIAAAYRTDAFGDDKPGGWPDFWNVDRFPARRSLRRFPMDTMEAALQAAGHSADPLDPSLAFASLDLIRPHIDIWWSSGSEQQFLLSDNRTDMAAITSMRAVEAARLGAPIGIGWSGNIRTTQGWGVLKGSPNAEHAKLFLDFIATPERQAACSMGVATSPTILAANALIAPDRRDDLPDAHADEAVISDYRFWSQNKTPQIVAFERWFAGS